MNGLSLFNGMGCFEIALIELGIYLDTLYTSEIDKHALNQTRLNFPNNIELGDVRNIDVSKLKPIHILAGGSPCQSFSFAGKRKGMATKCDVEIYTIEKYLELKEQGFEFEGQSYLFWEYMRILNDIRKYNPDVLFLLENVEMGNKWERVLSEAIGIYGVHINSALVSAQNRKRIYWTNIRTRQEGLFGELHADIPQPADRGILLRDILEKEVDKKYYLSDKMVRWIHKHEQKSIDNGNGFRIHTQENDKALSLSVSQLKQNLSSNYVSENISFNKDNLVMQLNPSKESGGVQPYQQNRGYDENGIMPALTAELGGRNNVSTQHRIRRLTPTECARLQTVPEWYKWACSDTQEYRMLGNGWTIAVIMHILSYLPEEYKNIR